MTFDPTRPTGPQPQPFSPAPPEPANPTTQSAWSAPTGPVQASPPALATPPVAPAAKPKGSGGRWLNLVLAVAAAVAIGGVAFAVGRSTAPVSAATGGNGRGAFANGSFAPRASGQPGFGGRGGFGGGAGAGLSINGTVKSVDGNTLTITTANGQTIEVTTGDSTTYHTPGARDRGRRQDGLERAGPAPVRRQRRRGPPERELGTDRPDRHRRQRHRRPVIEGVR